MTSFTKFEEIIAGQKTTEYQFLLYGAFDKCYIYKEEQQQMYNLADEICSMIAALIKTIYQSGNRSCKFKK